MTEASTEAVAAVPSPGPAAREGWRERLAQATVHNPVLVKELRTRMRGPRAYWILLAYTLLIASILAFAYYAHWSSMIRDADSVVRAAREAQNLGRVMYHIVFITQALLVGLITPAITSGAITIEREQRSYELLVTTPLSPQDLVRGKLIAAVAFTILLLTASLPLVSLTFLVGGVSPNEILISYLLVGLSAFVTGSIGIFWSAALKTTSGATVAAYVTVGFLFFQTLLPVSIPNFGGGRPVQQMPFKSLNPISATFVGLSPDFMFGGELASWIGAAVVLPLIGLLMTQLAMGRLEHFEPPRAFWVRLTATLLWLALGVFALGPTLGEALRAPAGGPSVELAGALLFVAWMVAFVVPMWNTGAVHAKEGESVSGRYLWGFLPHRMLGRDLSNGLPLTLVSAALLAAIIPLGALSAGRPNFAHLPTVFAPALVTIMAAAFGFAGIGNLLSVTTRNRSYAIILTYFFQVLLGIAPYFANSPWDMGDPIAPSPLWLLLYFSPLESVLDLVAGSTRWGTKIVLPVEPMWIVTTAFYLLLGAVCFSLTARKIRRHPEAATGAAS